MARNIRAEVVSILAKAREPSREDKIDAIVFISKALELGDVLELHLKSLGDDGTMRLLSEEDLHQVFAIARTWVSMANHRPKVECDEDGVVVEFKVPEDR